MIKFNLNKINSLYLDLFLYKTKKKVRNTLKILRNKLKRRIYQKISITSKISNFFYILKKDLFYLHVNDLKLNNFTIKN